MADKSVEGQVSFSMSFHPALLGPTAAHWLDDPADVSSIDSTRQYGVDDPRLSSGDPLGSGLQVFIFATASSLQVFIVAGQAARKSP